MSHTTERSPVHETPSSVQVPPMRPRRSAAQVARLGRHRRRVGRSSRAAAADDHVGHQLAADPERTAVGRESSRTTSPDRRVSPWSADAAERYLANHNATRPEGVPLVGRRRRALPRQPERHSTGGCPSWSADAAERYLANHE